MDQITLSRNELYELAWEFPFTTLAKKYDISDVGLRMRWFQKAAHIFAHHDAKWEFKKGSRPERVMTLILSRKQQGCWLLGGAPRKYLRRLELLKIFISLEENGNYEDKNKNWAKRG